MTDDHIHALFLQELEEQTAVLSHELLELEQDQASRDTLDRLFRAAHSLKGAAQVTGARGVADIAHGMETVLSQIRAQRLAPSTQVISALLVAVDWLADAAAVVASYDEPDTRQARRLRAELEQLAEDDNDPTGLPEELSAAMGAEGSPAQKVAARSGDNVRVAPAKLDGLLRQVSEITVARQRVDALRQAIASAGRVMAEHDAQWRMLRTALGDAKRRGALPPEIAREFDRTEETWRTAAASTAPVSAHASQAERELRQAALPLLDSVLDLRTMPFERLCEGLDRMVRDLSHRTVGKEVVLTVQGGGVELDRSVALALREPLIHLVHNAVDHGIEPAEDRQNAGKPAAGQVMLTAELRGGRVEVSVRDDGAGLRADELQTAAAASGMGQLDDFEDLLRAAFTPGVSTASTVTDTSGRGVGLDAVRARVDALGGSVRVDSEQDVGTVVTLTAPLTLSILHTLTVDVAGQVVMLSSAGVQRVIHVDREEIQAVGGFPTILVEDQHRRLIELADVLGWPTDDSSPPRRVPTILVEAAGASVGLTVSALLGEGETMVHGLGERLGNPPATVGATLLPAGGVAVILSAVACARLGAALSPNRTFGGRSVAPAPVVSPRVLLAEDTMTTRVLEQGILEAAGYDVVVAVDGADAWQKLREGGADVVVSDVNMPGMDGFELCAAIRGSQRFADVPVVLVTSLADEGDRRRGLEVGANAYIVKSGFDQHVLLETVGRLLT